MPVNKKHCLETVLKTKIIAKRENMSATIRFQFSVVFSKFRDQKSDTKSGTRGIRLASLKTINQTKETTFGLKIPVFSLTQKYYFNSHFRNPGNDHNPGAWP